MTLWQAFLTLFHRTRPDENRVRDAAKKLDDAVRMKELLKQMRHPRGH